MTRSFPQQCVQTARVRTGHDMIRSPRSVLHAGHREIGKCLVFSRIEDVKQHLEDVDVTDVVWVKSDGLETF